MSGVNNYMTKEDELKLKFYKNGTAEAVLERFMFTEKEKKLIQDAIRTANMPNPRMKLIDEVDELLKDVAKFREPIVIESEIKISPKDMIKFVNMKTKATQRKNCLDNEEKIPSLLGFKFRSKYGKRVFLFLLVVFFGVQYYMTTSAIEMNNAILKNHAEMEAEMEAKTRAILYGEDEGTPVKY